jgi:hypothetical protein
MKFCENCKMLPKKLKKNISYIDVLSKAKKKQRDAIIKTADNELIQCLCECALNILNGNVPLKNSDFQRLSKYKQQLRNLSDPDIHFNQKRDVLQRGGFLPLLLTPILTLAGQLLANSLAKNDAR